MAAFQITTNIGSQQWPRIFCFHAFTKLTRFCLPDGLAEWTGTLEFDTETDGDFTPAREKKWLFNIKPQHITLKPAGQTQNKIGV